MLLKLLLLAFLSAACLAHECKDKIIKPGECPAALQEMGCGCGWRVCAGDWECEGDLKCCKLPDGTSTCVQPAVPEKPGSCPVDDKIPSCFKRPHECTSDYECEDDQKCCLMSGRKICTKPAKSWECPAPNPAVICLAPSPEVEALWCKDDSECAADKKCCYVDCQRKCIAREKIGYCPAVNPLNKCANIPPEVMKDWCVDDYSCTGIQKCCFVGCNKVCTDPEYVKPGTCPVDKMIPDCFGKENECDWDLDCPDDLKCCSSGRRKFCKKPLPPGMKDGQCPPASKQPCILDPLQPPPVDECTVDTECPGNLKCCPGVCNAECKSPWDTTGSGKPGTCPKNDLITICRVPENACMTDEDCKGSLKCCSVGCNKECVQPEGTEDVCQMGPIEEGKTNDCKAYMPRYTYDAEKGVCVEFIYGGCNAGKNLFMTEEECEETCVKVDSTSCECKARRRHRTWCANSSY